MARIQKTVFISYRRTDVYTALAVYENLKNQGYDVFFDYRSISSGDFEQIISSNIRARAHFLLILTPTALERCNEPGDWLKREIEIAIDEKRNIVPLFFKGFRFGTPSVSANLTGKLSNLSRYNGLNVHEDYFDEAMYRLRTQYLSVPLNTVLHPVSTEVQKAVRQEQVAADKALEQIEDIKELVKQAEVKHNAPMGESILNSVESPKENRAPATTARMDRKIEKPGRVPPPLKDESKGEGVLRLPERVKLNPRLIGGIAGGLLVISLCIWGGARLISNMLIAPPEPTRTARPVTAVPTEALATEAPTSAQITLTIDSNISDMITLDPAVVYEYSGILVIHNVYQTLVTFVGSDLQTIKPGLADTWETTDAGDHWELTFKLHPGNMFASGNPITADDVVYSFNRVLAINGSPAFLFTDVAGLTADSVTAVDPETVVINLPKTASPGAFLAILTSTVASVVDSKVVQENEGSDHGSTWLLDHSAGSGAYVVDHWTKEVEVLLTANPNFNGDKPALSSVLISHVPESANQLTALQRGDADIAMNLTAEQLATLGGDATSVKGADPRLFYLGMNVAVPPLDKVEVREALRMAIDYDGIVNDLLSGNAQKVQTIIPSPMFGYNGDAPFQQDIEGAKALLEQAGVSDVSLEMLIPDGAAPGGVQWSDLAAKLQSDWAQIGVNVEIRQVTIAELLDAYRAQGAQLALLYWGPDFADPDTNVTPFTNYDAHSIAWRNSWNDAYIAAKAHDAALMTDRAAREAAYKEITEYVLHNGPYVVLYQPYALFGVRNTVANFEWNPMGFTDFWSITKIG